MSRRGTEAVTLSIPWPTTTRGTAKRASADGAVLAVTVVLALFGLVMVFSASAVVAGNRFGDPIYFLKRQMVWMAFGFLLFHLASRLDYTMWRKLALPLVAGTGLLLILVLIPTVGTMVNGARRWLSLGPISVQPAEVAKLGAVFYLASFLAKGQDRVRELATGVLPPLIIVALLAGLVMLQPDLGTVALIGLVTLGLLFLGGARLTHLIGLMLVTIPVVAALVLSSEYRRQRVMAFLDPWKDPADTGFQITQSFLAFGNGGLLGVGLGQGKQKLFFLPEAHTDFVLALVGEELGLMGAATVLLLFGFLVFKGFQIARRAREPFGRYLAMGLTLLIGLQVLINAGVVTGLLPTKGLTLPLISYGGSSLVVSLVAVGILQSISRDRQGGRQKDLTSRGRGAGFGVA
ncbi:MAG: putative lipid II flippase FtsW [Nitrospiraceae bacterium]